MDGPSAAAETALTDLTATQLRTYAESYDALSRGDASHKVRGGRSLVVTFGPTGAAKTLFALRPNAIPPWDEPIRRSVRATGDMGSFRVYLTNIARQVRSLADEAGVAVESLPMLVDRPESSPPKLIDEYNWIVVTKGIMPPGRA